MPRPRTAVPTVDQAVMKYLSVRQQNTAANTFINDSSVLHNLRRSLGPKRLDDLTGDDFHEMFSGPGGVGERNPSAASFNKVRQRVLLFLRFCADEGWPVAPGNLLRHVGKKRVVKRERLTLSPRELFALLDTTSIPRDRALLAACMHTGLRAGEVTSLKWADINLDRDEIKVWISKSQAEDTFPMSEELGHELRRWKRAYALEVAPYAPPGYDLDDSYVFPSATGQVWIKGADGRRVRQMRLQPWASMQHPERVVQAALAALGYDTKGHGVHVLRRSAGRAFYELTAASGHDLAVRETMAFMHHKNAATTEGYLGLGIERKRRDDRLRGRPFLGALITDVNVVQFDTHLPSDDRAVG